MTEVYASLGTNKGRCLKNIKTALKKLNSAVRIKKLSSLYLTEPVNVKGGWFINCVVGGQTEQKPQELLQNLLHIEKQMGRVGTREDKRVIDIDLLLYGSAVIQNKKLTVPHPRMHRRRFVLIPLVEIQPQLRHPVLDRDIQSLLTELKDSCEVEKIGTTDFS